ncbi:hypothetical protein MUN89_10075 [Halobacillus salinarum]|uniref:Uncharacterized protein n=1 Tax=Halobacillus salinarum TaxID=2932257 RepID=A0ABY4EP28_9BACI|nr:hypothetical protein [Halobacillus salinarum]UOQ46222.1 hypothetical protein MUN89_10075 [Halobacillus salinarum]
MIMLTTFIGYEQFFKETAISNFILIMLLTIEVLVIHHLTTHLTYKIHWGIVLLSLLATHITTLFI